ncbi:MAG: DUF1552 domain-containing protein [Lentisphaeraceae bacterium]|nr:DUF1552 domain-containing protein [Lentisphaeraceae bacterium]
MKQKSWHLNRRTFLRTTGVCLALPWLEGMSADKNSTKLSRFFAGYFPYGIPVPADDDANRLAHGWFPLGTGKDYKCPEMHKGFMPLRDKVTFLSGLSHPYMRKTSSHKGADHFLTGANILNDYEKQGISIDQFLANSIGTENRFKSLVLSSRGGVNRPYRSATLSFDRSGRAIPSLCRPAEIFRKMFGQVTRSERQELDSSDSILDEVLEDAKSLNRKLGKNDKNKMDEYLESVREVEKMTQRAVKWQDTPKPKVDSSKLKLGLDATEPKDYLETMYKLVVLAFQTNSSRVSTFQVACEAALHEDKFPSAIGISANAHKLSHENNDYTERALYTKFLNDLYADFLSQLNNIQEGDGTLLDNTLCFYGCATGKTHMGHNYPLILSGGKNIGFKHGKHLNFSEDVPLSNLFVTMANQFSVPAEKFTCSTGDMGEVV